MKRKILEINLSGKEITRREYDSGLWLGGRGLATRIFCDLVDPLCDPLGPDNTVVFAVSPLTGTTAPTAGRGHVVFKSPLTGGIGSSNSGGKWGKVMKSAGWDALVVKGSAPSPVYIEITDKGDKETARVEIKDASHLWGKSVHEASRMLLRERGSRSASVLGIGPAGENKARYASLMNDMNRAYGRGGSGAVFGAKNLKAIVVEGSRKTEVADPDRLKNVVEQTRHVMKAVPATKRVMRELGTAGLVHLINIMGMLPHRNFQDCTHDENLLENISGEAVAERILERAGTCFGCPIMCQRHTRVGDKTGEGPEFETVVLMGALLDVYDLDRITLGNYAANELGLDTMSLGGTLSCAAELFETGTLRPADFSGESVRFGDSGIYPEMVERISRRQGLGGLLAEGSRIMAEKAGRPQAAMHVKGMEIPAYDPRGMPAQALGYMTSPTGACHLRGGYSIGLGYFGGFKEVPRFSFRQAALTAINQQNLGIIHDSMGICRFTGFAVGADHWARIYSAVTGVHTSTDELEKTAERIATLERLFNLEAGLARADDDLPGRFKIEAITIGGRSRIISEDDRDRMLSDYYRERGWDVNGEPLPETLEKLEIEKG